METNCVQSKRWFSRNLFQVRNGRTQSRSMLAESKRESRQGRLGDRKRWFQRKGMVLGTMVKPGHTWDRSWHQSKWHGETYGPEVDSCTAVELVPYLCAVSWNSSCEDISEPKRMSGGTHTKTSQSGSPKNFAHLLIFRFLRRTTTSLLEC